MSQIRGKHPGTVFPGAHGTLLISDCIFSLRAKPAAVPPEPRAAPVELPGSGSAGPGWHGQGEESLLSSWDLSPNPTHPARE